MATQPGAIRAWADYPSYDANNYGGTGYALLKDQAVSGLYEPGSVMKVVTFAGGLNNKAITPQTTIEEGPVSIGGDTPPGRGRRAHGARTKPWVGGGGGRGSAPPAGQRAGRHQ